MIISYLFQGLGGGCEVRRMWTHWIQNFPNSTSTKLSQGNQWHIPSRNGHLSVRWWYQNCGGNQQWRSQLHKQCYIGKPCIHKKLCSWRMFVLEERLSTFSVKTKWPKSSIELISFYKKLKRECVYRQTGGEKIHRSVNIGYSALFKNFQLVYNQWVFQIDFNFSIRFR